MLDIHIPTFVFVMVNLLILYFVLNKILFKPVTKFMENRANSIKEALENADKAKVEAAELKSRFDEQIRQAKVEAEKILNDARSRANKEYEAVISSAKQDAQAVLERARQEGEREKVQMFKEVKNQVATLALAAASKVLEANMDTDRNREIVNKFVDEAGAA